MYLCSTGAGNRFSNKISLNYRVVVDCVVCESPLAAAFYFQCLMIDYRFLLLSPGLVIRPHAAEISFNRSDPTNYDQYIQQLHDLLQREYNKHPALQS